jgi:hypothetical protein
MEGYCSTDQSPQKEEEEEEEEDTLYSVRKVVIF